MAGRNGQEVKWELLEVREDGTEVRLYPGGEKRNQNGQLLEAAPWNELITPETSREYQRRRKEKVLDAIEKKLMDVTKTTAPAEAIAHIVGKKAQVAIDDDSRTGNEAAKIVLAAVDAYQDKKSEEKVNTTRHEYVMDDETRALLQAVLQERRGNVIDTEE
jgi:hypothetical protein